MKVDSPLIARICQNVRVRRAFDNMQCELSSRWWFWLFSQTMNWVRLRFFQQVNGNMVLIHTKFKKNPDWNSKVTIKTWLCCVLIATNCPKLLVHSANESKHCELSCRSLFHFFQSFNTPKLIPRVHIFYKTSLSWYIMGRKTPKLLVIAQNS